MGKHLVYIIDDDEIYQFTTKRMIELGEFDVEVEAFLNAKDALDRLNTVNPDKFPDFIFLDINMPGMDGWEFLQKLNIGNTITTKIPKIYMVSSSTDANDQVKSKTFDEVEEYIVKPFSFDLLKKFFA